MTDSNGIWRIYNNFVDQARRRRAERRIAAAVSELPQHLLKDIGWPAGYHNTMERRGR
ncbi:MAG: hypothetical protein ACR2O0_12955 [Rhizobiaceae bacterium]